MPQFDRPPEVAVTVTTPKTPKVEITTSIMPRYRSHKHVYAAKIKEVLALGSNGGVLIFEDEYYADKQVDGEWVAAHKPQAGGYLVVYKDGYASFSPAKPFEDGYHSDPYRPIVRELRSHMVNGLNEAIQVSVHDQPGSGGACHHYSLALLGEDGFMARRPDGSVIPTLDIHFQNGPIKEAGLNGYTHESILAVIKDRLEGFQDGPYASRDNQEALDHIDAAIEALHRRTKARVARGVEGTHEK